MKIKNVKYFYKSKLKQAFSKMDSIEKDIKEISKMIKNQQNELPKDADPKTAIQKLLEWLQKESALEHCKEETNLVLKKAFELLSEEKDQMIDFFVEGFKYSDEDYNGTVFSSSSEEELLRAIADDYYTDLYTINSEE